MFLTRPPNEFSQRSSVTCNKILVKNSKKKKKKILHPAAIRGVAAERDAEPVRVFTDNSNAVACLSEIFYGSKK